jgi:hypothetical protein
LVHWIRTVFAAETYTAPIATPATNAESGETLTAEPTTVPQRQSADQMPTDRISEIVERLNARIVSIALILDDGLAVIQAHCRPGRPPAC